MPTYIEFFDKIKSYIYAKWKNQYILERFPKPIHKAFEIVLSLWCFFALNISTVKLIGAIKQSFVNT